MLFDPEESIQFQGNTGPFIQYTYARIRSILNRAEDLGVNKTSVNNDIELTDTEKDGVKLISEFGIKIDEAAREYSPAVIAQYIYDLAKEYNRFYAELPIFNEADENLLKFRVLYSRNVASVIKRGMGLLGIDVPNQM
jgi:arginyl-tRNA synthetase